MHKCIVCGNSSNKTKVNCPGGVIYHGIPKNAFMRRKWLKVIGIDHCHDWQRICSDHFLEENYKPGKKRFLFSNAIPQPYKRNGFPSNYATQSDDVETGNNVILPMEQNIIKEEHIGNAIVNNLESLRWSSRLTENNEDMSNKNMLNHTLGSGLRCSVKNCLNRLSKNLSLFGFPKDLTLRKKWMEKCGIKKDPAKIVMSSTRVCSSHFELHCFKNTELKSRLKPGAVPSLFLDNVPTALPISINEVPVLSTCEDQFISPIENEAAEQSSSEKKNNLKDNTDNTFMKIDLTIDDSSNSSMSITLEPIEKRKNCNTEDLTRDEHGIIFEISNQVVLPNIYWKSEHLSSENAARFVQHDANDEIVKIIYFYDNLVPSIQIYGKKYEYTTPITTMKELGDLLEKIDSIEKCYGRGGFVFDQCLGYYENSLDTEINDDKRIKMCSVCQELIKDRDLQRMKAKLEAKNKTIESFKNRIAEKREIVLQERRKMAEMVRNRQIRLALEQSGISNIMKP
ncbi:uncharacterized protein LOC100572541 isoform X2 [Acyrthosiphon pisum]|uniref:THAP-type domain-containing protein n=1 Tax=Acyrthosiphon pisum TaxID=7029 RepID=A0A8R2A5R3_ACYPI|nr:uncharacterized protein LOC100572541 isoform X2 [Acyrthosiphon pisum]|eukprot:XP_003242833.1 PREDICTED: uncharacterized protein LOC100572541 [Acyrthosiphon pisum]